MGVLWNLTGGALAGKAAKKKAAARTSMASDMIFAPPPVSVVGDEDDEAIDVERKPKQGEPPVPGAQWNEVAGCWERWDRDAEAWVAVT